MAQSAPSLKVHEVFSVSPPQGSAPSTLPLTFFDIMWLRFPPVERLFFYESPDATSSSFFDSVLPSLKRSLELTLRDFLPLAGNITWPPDSPTPIITYLPGVDSVPFTVAESTEHDFNLLSSNLCQASKRHCLVPRLMNVTHEKASLLALQVTLFPSAGFCIGITAHHAAVDGKSSTLFMKAWAHLCSKISRGEESPRSLVLPESLTPLFDRSAVKDTKGITQAYLDSWLNHGGPNNRSLMAWESTRGAENDAVKATFELTPSQTQALKRRAQSKGKVNKASTFSVTCAYLLCCLVKAENPESKKVGFIFSVDCRPRLEPPLAPNYFGSCILGWLVMEEKERLVGSNGFVNAVEGINDMLDEIEEKGVLNDAENRSTKVQPALGLGSRLFSIAGSPRFEVYGIDFGWGRPKKVDVISPVDRAGKFALSDSRDGGVEIGLVLNEAHVEAFAALFAQGLDGSV